MIDFQQKKQFKKIIYSKIFFVIFIILIFFLGRATYNIYNKSKLSYDNYIIVKRDYENLKDRKGMLVSEINRLKTDSGIEEEIRDKFNVAKPGETVVTVISSSSVSADINDSNKGFWSGLWGIFK
jgi:cell division protein FtsB